MVPAERTTQCHLVAGQYCPGREIRSWHWHTAGTAVVRRATEEESDFTGDCSRDGHSPAAAAIAGSLLARVAATVWFRTASGADRYSARGLPAGLYQLGARLETRSDPRLALRQTASGAVWRVHPPVFQVVHRTDEYPFGGLQSRCVHASALCLAGPEIGNQHLL